MGAHFTLSHSCQSNSLNVCHTTLTSGIHMSSDIWMLNFLLGNMQGMIVIGKMRLSTGYASFRQVKRPSSKAMLAARPFCKPSWMALLYHKSTYFSSIWLLFLLRKHIDPRICKDHIQQHINAWQIQVLHLAKQYLKWEEAGGPPPEPSQMQEVWTMEMISFSGM